MTFIDVLRKIKFIRAKIDTINRNEHTLKKVKAIVIAHFAIYCHYEFWASNNGVQAKMHEYTIYYTDKTETLKPLLTLQHMQDCMALLTDNLSPEYVDIAKKEIISVLASNIDAINRGLIVEIPRNKAFLQAVYPNTFNKLNNPWG